MSKTIKCIIRQEWENRNAEGWIIERSGYVYVTNEDGTPHVYDSIKDARAEIRANFGRDANKSGILHTHSVDDYSGNVHDGYIYIVREDTQEYAEALEQAQQDAAPEYIEPVTIQTVSGNTIYRSTDPVTNESVFTVAGRDFWTLAEARYFAQCNPVATSEALTEAVEQAEDAARFAETESALTSTARLNGDVSGAAEHSQKAATYAEKASRASLEAYHINGNKCHEAASKASRKASEHAAEAIRAFYETFEKAQREAKEAEELEERAEIIAAIEAEDLRERIQTEAERYQWSPEETRESIAFYLASRASKAAARALVSAYAETIGETIEDTDPEAVAAYRVAHDEMHNRHHHATTNDREQVAYMVDVIARANTRPDLTKYESMTYLDMTA